MQYISNHIWIVEMLLALPGVGALKCIYMDGIVPLPSTTGPDPRKWALAPVSTPSNFPKFFFPPLPCTWYLLADSVGSVSYLTSV